MADVPVCLRSWARRGIRTALFHARTGALGRARLDHLNLFSSPGSTGWTHVVAVDIPLGEPVQREVDLFNLPVDPIELRLPALGSVVVKVRTSEEVTEPFTIALGPAPGKTDDIMIPLDGATSRSATPSGEAAFQVGLGLSLRDRSGRKIRHRRSVPRPIGPRGSLARPGASPGLRPLLRRRGVWRARRRHPPPTRRDRIGSTSRPRRGGAFGSEREVPAEGSAEAAAR